MPVPNYDPVAGSPGHTTGTGTSGGSGYTNDVDPIAGQPKNATPRPTKPGKTRGDNGGGNNDGFWIWSGTTWVWLGKGGAQSASDAYSVGGFTGFSNPDEANKARADYTNALGKNPFGNAFDTKLSYTPFGLQGSGQQFGGGGGAFGAPMMGRQTDQLTPQLEQLRMQRITQAYPMFGGR